MKYSLKLKNIKLLIIISSTIIILLLISLSFKNLFHTNQYGDEIKIDNISDYYNDMPQDTQDSIYNTLYNTVSNNLNDKSQIPKNGAVIRNDQHTNNFDQKTNIHSGNFIVDIDSIQQSYNISFEWTDEKDNYYSSGYPVLITCINDKFKIYDFDCKQDSQSYEALLTKYPLLQVLPINVEYYSNNYTSYTKYSITYRLSEKDQTEVIIKITDYSGDGYEKAIKSISDRGYNPNDYNIEYENLSSNY